MKKFFLVLLAFFCLQLTGCVAVFREPLDLQKDREVKLSETGVWSSPAFALAGIKDVRLRLDVQIAMK